MRTRWTVTCALILATLAFDPAAARAQATSSGSGQKQVPNPLGRPGLPDALAQSVMSGNYKASQAAKKLSRGFVLKHVKQAKQRYQKAKNKTPHQMLDLALLYGDLLTIDRAKVRELDEPITRARRAGSKGKAKTLIKQQDQREKAVSSSRAEAIKLLALVARNHTGFARRDEAFFRLAFIIDQQATDDRSRTMRDGNAVPSQNEQALRQQSRRVFRELIKNYPTSRFIPHGYLSFGEYYFISGTMNDALEFYNRVTQYTNSDVYGYAVYKTAWCYINLHDDRQAVSQFVRVIQHVQSNPNAALASPLADQARREIIAPFARSFPPTQAWAFFQRIGGNQGLQMMERLAERYFIEQQWAEAITSYHVLMSENPGTSNINFYKTRIAECNKNKTP